MSILQFVRWLYDCQVQIEGKPAADASIEQQPVFPRAFRLVNCNIEFGSVSGLVRVSLRVILIRFLSLAPYSFEFFQENQADLSSRNRSERAAGLQGLLVLKGLFPAREADAQ